MPEPSQTPPPTPPPQTPPPGAAARAADEDARSPSSSSTSPNGTSTLIREEIELAKAEVTEKVSKLLRGSVVGIAAGVFAFLALILVMEGIAWLLNEEVFDGKTWPGFFIEAAVFLLIAAARRLLRLRAVKAGSPPVPEQAIEEAKLTKDDVRRRSREPAEGVEHTSSKEAANERRPEPAAAAGAPGRSAAQIRRDIDVQRQQLGTSVEALRGRVTELTDWRRQVDEHRSQLIVGAAVVGFAVGVRAMLRRRR